jgi:hypothetical protein
MVGHEASLMLVGDPRRAIVDPWCQTYGVVHDSAGVANGPPRRISVQVNTRPGPSTASTTSSTVIEAGSRVSTIAARPCPGPSTRSRPRESDRMCPGRTHAALI